MSRLAVAPEGRAWVALAVLLCAGAIVVAGGTDAGAAWAAGLDWRPGLLPREAWRPWTCAWVHGSPAHLAVNLAGGLVVALVGWRARTPGAAALAWFAAWPLTHLLMLLPGALHATQPLQRYGGLSGVLHAGAIVLGLTLAWPRDAGPADGAFRATTSTQPPSRPTEGPWATTSLAELSEQGRAGESSAALPPLTPAQARRHRLIGLALVAGTIAKSLLETPWDLALRPNAALGIQIAPLAHACGIAAGAIAWGMVELPARARARRRPADDGAS